MRLILAGIIGLTLSQVTVRADASVNADYEAGASRKIGFLSDWSFFGFKQDNSDPLSAAYSKEKNPLDNLVDTALVYVGYESVPYVWGGNKIGSSSACSDCSQCILKYKKRGARKRHLKCTACSQCGMDCSHFVQNVFATAGMHFPFMSTKSFLRVNGKKPNAIPGLRYVGSDLRHARPGDLLVQKKHVVILINKKSDTRGDVVHMSRTVRDGKIGGIALQKDVDLTRFFGGVRKVFRHEQLLFDQPTSDVSTANPDYLIVRKNSDMDAE